MKIKKDGKIGRAAAANLLFTFNRAVPAWVYLALLSTLT
jgi:hypothetical protein